jgi:hypothetical protein
MNTAIPARMARLPLDKHGRIVPWFVAWIDGQPDHRIVGEGKPAEAIIERRCWLRGHRLGVYATFVIGPMCAVNRISAEPPSHRDCAVYAATVCPFLTTPRMNRRENGKPADITEPAGIMIKRNPGVALVWTTRRWAWKNDPGAGGYLAHLGDPTETLWFAEGREATREEITASIDSGLELLQAHAAEDDNPAAALAELDRMHAGALQLVPADTSST